MIYLILLIVLSGIVGILWALFQFFRINKVDIRQQNTGHYTDNDMADLEQETGGRLRPLSAVEIGRIIHEGATQFIRSQYKICTTFVILMSVVIWICVDQFSQLYTTVAFFVGAATSMLCGALGLEIATFSNYRTALQAQNSLGSAFKTAYRAACVMGFVLVSVSMLFLLAVIMIYRDVMGLHSRSVQPQYFERLFESVAGYGLGGSTVALFARVGGGIFTKAADLGSDLVGKLESSLPEDSPRNPATIADNVGDNVGDVAGMGADLFGSFAQATCAAMIIGCTSLSEKSGQVQLSSILFVLAIPAVGIIVSLIVSTLITDFGFIKQSEQVQKYLKNQLLYSSVVLVPFLLGICRFFMESFKFNGQQKTYIDLFMCICMGLIAGLGIGYYTEIMTSYSYKPVQELAQSCRTGPATNIIYGLALGYLSTIVPVILICFVCYFSHMSLGYYGVSLAALGMLSNLPLCLAIDSYGPISDNAGGIAEMAGMPSHVRKITDVLDSAGNTTAAVGKGFAIGSATLVGFALYGAFLHRVYSFGTIKAGSLSFDDPLIFTSMLFGSMIPYAFSALTMKSVGLAAIQMIDEVRRQVKANPGILNGTAFPDYRACVKISTEASLKEMKLPGLLVTVTPFLLGFAFGPKALIGFLPGAIVSGVQMAISASNTGGAWDNAKKYIEAGKLEDEQGKVELKGSEAHKAAVIGDTVGDPLKDTSGPSLNILIKLMAILSLVFCKYFSQ